MKNFVKSSLLALAAVVVCGLSVLTSCTEDDENLIVGTWDLVKEQVTVTATGSELVDPTTLTQDVKVEQVAVTIKADGTWKSTSVDAKGKKSEGEGTWSIKDSKLYITTQSGDGPETDYMNIDSLTAKEMVLSYSDTYEEEGITYSGKVVMTFNKR